MKTYKLSYFPNTFVGIADVNSEPNSSLYALRGADEQGEKREDAVHLTGSGHLPSVLHVHIQNYFREVTRDEF
jgi:hypothetical protein